jgi:2-phosphosulfolactate phosphatase
MRKIYCEWGEQGLRSLKDLAEVIVIIDVLSFTTCVDIVVNNKGYVLPYINNDDTAIEYAKQNDAFLSRKRGQGEYTLSPDSLIHFPEGKKLVLPSPNGSTLTTICKNKYVFAGCLRNASAVASVINNFKADTIAVIPAGERWQDGSLRVAYEDLIGAGAVINELEGEKDAEAKMAEMVFKHSLSLNFENIKSLKSGIELIDRGYSNDVARACEYNISKAAPYLLDGKYYYDYFNRVSRN